MKEKIELCNKSIAPNEELELIIKGLDATKTYKIKSEMKDDAQRTWSAWGLFSPDEEGKIDLNKARPIKGSYNEVKRNGLLWSMELKNNDPNLPPYFIKQGSSSHNITFSLSEKNKIIDKFDIQLYLKSKTVETEEIASPIIGKYFKPKEKKQVPGVIIAGGSSGGLFWSEQMAAMLSSQGFATLALNYFDPRIDKLPDQLMEIELEYFLDAYKWLQSKPEVNEKNIHMIGISKGAEASLLFGSIFSDKLSSITAYVPSSYVYEGISMGKREDQSSWKYGGESFNFIPYPEGTEFSMNMNPVDLREIHDKALSNATQSELSKAKIPVENIDCPVLLISAGKDGTWDSKMMSEAMIQEIQTKEVRHIHFKEMGHTFFVPNLPPLIANPLVSKYEAQKANDKSLNHVIDFLFDSNNG